MLGGGPGRVVGPAGDAAGRRSSGSGWTKPNGSAAALRTVLEDPEIKCFINDDAPTTECVRYFVRRYLERGSLYRVASDE